MNIGPTGSIEGHLTGVINSMYRKCIEETDYESESPETIQIVQSGEV